MSKLSEAMKEIGVFQNMTKGKRRMDFSVLSG